MIGQVSRRLNEESVGVTLSPVEAKEVARTLRLQLAHEFDRLFDESLPSREHAVELRMFLDLCVDQLEALAWGEPDGQVQMIAPRLLLEAISSDLRDGGNERLANPMCRQALEIRTVRRQARQMIRAADAINGALGVEQGFLVTS